MVEAPWGSGTVVYIAENCNPLTIAAGDGVEGHWHRRGTRLARLYGENTDEGF